MVVASHRPGIRRSNAMSLLSSFSSSLLYAKVLTLLVIFLMFKGLDWRSGRRLKGQDLLLILSINITYTPLQWRMALLIHRATLRALQYPSYSQMLGKCLACKVSVQLYPSKYQTLSVESELCIRNCLHFWWTAGLMWNSDLKFLMVSGRWGSSILCYFNKHLGTR